MRASEEWSNMSSDSDSDDYPVAPAQKARDANILGVFEATDDPVLTTSEVAAELPIGKRATLNRLEDLVDRGALASKDVGVGRVWWRLEGDEPEADSDDAGEQPVTDSVSEVDPQGTGPPEPATTTQPAGSARGEPLESESPGWAFVGSLGRHSIYAGVFLIGLLWTETQTAQQLLPVHATRLFLTSIVFFLIGFPAYAAYRVKSYFESTNLSLSQFTGPLGGADDRDPGG